MMGLAGDGCQRGPVGFQHKRLPPALLGHTDTHPLTDIKPVSPSTSNACKPSSSMQRSMKHRMKRSPG
jgi:hypothetical protein